MANLKTFGIVLLVGALATLAVLNYNSSTHKPALNSTLYSSWKAQQGFKLGASEDKIRQGLFHKSLQFVNAHNAKPNKSFEVGLNQFSAFTDEEFEALYLGDKKNVAEDLSHVVTLNTTLLRGPQSVDWTTKGAVTPVKDQGNCGSCWSFSATGALEGLRAVATGELVSLSEQQLLDCSSAYGNGNCDQGGLALYAFNYVIDNGIVKDSEYPYTARKGACNIPASAQRWKISKWSQVPQGDLAQMQAALAKQPLAVSVQANTNVFRAYKSGIFDDVSCGTSLNHAILAVGYEAGQYWKVKNSWNTKWGMDGYMHLAMKGGEGICGVNKRVTYPSV